ncbi:hypothetical protein DsansV1_C27g0198061 [Dioscorea sansibarensis]
MTFLRQCWIHPHPILQRLCFFSRTWQKHSSHTGQLPSQPSFCWIHRWNYSGSIRHLQRLPRKLARSETPTLVCFHPALHFSAAELQVLMNAQTLSSHMAPLVYSSLQSA